MSGSGYDDDLLPGSGWPPDSEPTDRADRILSGKPAPDDLAAGGDRVDRLVSSMRSGTAASDRDAERIGQITETIRAGAGEPAILSRVSLLRRASVRSAVAVAAVPLLLATAAAAATGSLPGPLQEVAHGVFSSLGVPGPSSDGGGRSSGEATGELPARGRTTTPTVHGPKAPAMTVVNACNAWVVNGPAPNAQAAKLIVRAATSAGVSAAQYCELLRAHTSGSGAAIALGGTPQVSAPTVPGGAGAGSSPETVPPAVAVRVSPPANAGGGTGGATGSGGGNDNGGGGTGKGTGNGNGNRNGNGKGNGKGDGNGHGNGKGNGNGKGKSASAPGHVG